MHYYTLNNDINFGTYFIQLLGKTRTLSKSMQLKNDTNLNTVKTCKIGPYICSFKTNINWLTVNNYCENNSQYKNVFKMSGITTANILLLYLVNKTMKTNLIIYVLVLNT